MHSAAVLYLGTAIIYTLATTSLFAAVVFAGPEATIIQLPSPNLVANPDKYRITMWFENHWTGTSGNPTIWTPWERAKWECDNREDKIIPYIDKLPELDTFQLGPHRVKTTCVYDVCFRFGTLSSSLETITHNEFTEAVTSVMSARLGRGCMGTSRSWVLPWRNSMFLEIYNKDALDPLEQYETSSFKHKLKLGPEIMPSWDEWKLRLPWHAKSPSELARQTFVPGRFFQHPLGWCLCERWPSVVHDYGHSAPQNFELKSMYKVFEDDDIDTSFSLNDVILELDRQLIRSRILFYVAKSRFGFHKDFSGSPLSEFIAGILRAKREVNENRETTCPGRSKCWLDISGYAPFLYIDILNEHELPSVLEEKEKDAVDERLKEMAVWKDFNPSKLFPANVGTKEKDLNRPWRYWCACDNDAPVISQLPGLYSGRHVLDGETLKSMLLGRSYKIQKDPGAAIFLVGDACFAFALASQWEYEKEHLAQKEIIHSIVSITAERAAGNCFASSRCWAYSLYSKYDISHIYVDVYKNSQRPDDEGHYSALGCSRNLPGYHGGGGAYGESQIPTHHRNSQSDRPKRTRDHSEEEQTNFWRPTTPTTLPYSYHPGYPNQEKYFEGYYQTPEPGPNPPTGEGKYSHYDEDNHHRYCTPEQESSWYTDADHQYTSHPDATSGDNANPWGRRASTSHAAGATHLSVPYEYVRAPPSPKQFHGSGYPYHPTEAQGAYDGYERGPPSRRHPTTDPWAGEHAGFPHSAAEYQHETHRSTPAPPRDGFTSTFSGHPAPASVPAQRDPPRGHTTAQRPTTIVVNGKTCVLPPLRAGERFTIRVGDTAPPTRGDNRHRDEPESRSRHRSRSKHRSKSRPRNESRPRSRSKYRSQSRHRYDLGARDDEPGHQYEEPQRTRQPSRRRSKTGGSGYRPTTDMRGQSRHRAEVQERGRSNYRDGGGYYDDDQ